MGFYNRWVVPHLVNMSMRQDRLVPYRQRAIQSARGRVLEIGVGSGLNLPLYGEAVTHVVGLEPSQELLSMATHAAAGAKPPIGFVRGSAEAIPLKAASVDTVVTTWTLCTIPDVTGALAEMRRVLTPAGHLIFVEHGRAPDRRVTWWQDRLTPFWKPIGGGCHLNRPIRELVEASGFTIEQIATGYMKGPKALTFMYEGLARPA